MWASPPQSCQWGGRQPVRIRTAPFSTQCPFHGKIIPRDDAGQPLNAEDRAREQRQQLQRPAGRPGGSGGRGAGLV